MVLSLSLRGVFIHRGRVPMQNNDPSHLVLRCSSCSCTQEGPELLQETIREKVLAIMTIESRLSKLRG